MRKTDPRRGTAEGTIKKNGRPGVLRQIARRPRVARAPGSEAEAIGAALLIVDARRGVVRALGWENLFGGPPPERIVPTGSSADPVLEALASAIEEAARSGVLAHRITGAGLDRRRLYSIAAGPLGGDAPRHTVVMALEIAATIQAGPQEGEAIRQLAHDLKSPLTSVSGAVELLQSGRLGSLSAPQLRLLGMVQKGVEMMLALIEKAAAPYREPVGKTVRGGTPAAIS